MLQWKTCLRAGITVALLYLAIHYWGPVSAALGVLIGAAWPLFLGAGIAYVVNILMRFYEKHFFRKSRRTLVARMRRAVCMVAAYLTIILIISAIVVLVVPELVRAIQLLLNETPALIDQLYETLMRYPAIAQYLPNAGTELAKSAQTGNRRSPAYSTGWAAAGTGCSTRCWPRFQACFPVR